MSAPRTRSVEFWYPRIDGPDTVDTIRVGLMDVRAADDLVIRYDFDRDGYSVSMATIHEWRDGDDRGEGLVEVAFVPAWVEVGDVAAERSAGAAPLDDDMRRFVDHVGGLHCDEYHPEGTCEWQLRCDEPKCKREVTCGYPTDNGYRRTCGAHALLYEGTDR